MSASVRLCNDEKVAQVANREGRQFRVRIVREGEAYGNRRQLTNTTGEPFVEFYDATLAGDDRFGALGQFVSRYGLGVLRESTVGINLDGGVPAWYLDEAPLKDAMTWVERQLA